MAETTTEALKALDIHPELVITTQLREVLVEAAESVDTPHALGALMTAVFVSVSQLELRVLRLEARE